MSEQDKPDPWALLASELGVESPPKDVKKEEPPANASPEAASVAPKAKPAPRAPSVEPRRSPQDWLRLASDLGVEVPEEAMKPQAPEPPVERAPLERAPVEKPRPSEPRESWTPVEDEILAELVEEPTETESEGGDRWQGEIEVVDSHAERGERGEKKLRRRRKRRRKVRRPDDQGGTEEPTEGAGHPIGSAELVEMVELIEESEDESLAPAEADMAAAQGEPGTEEEAPRRPKRRRRRRSGRKKPAGAAEKEGEAEVARRKPEAKPVPETDDLEDLDEDDDEVLEACEPGERKREKLKAIHRGIPTWREAIDVVVSANLESRAKHPEKHSYPRSRGGRGRNGRDKSSS